MGLPGGLARIPASNPECGTALIPCIFIRLMKSNHELSHTPVVAAARVALNGEQLKTNYRILNPGSAFNQRTDGWPQAPGDGAVIAATLRARGLTTFVNDVQHPGSFGDGTLVLPALPREMNASAERLLRDPQVHRIVWKPGTAQLHLLFIAGGSCDVIQLCSTKAGAITGWRSPRGAVEALAKTLRRSVTIVVTGPDTAAAVRGGEFAEADSFRDRFDEECDGSGRGAAFFGGFLATLDSGENLTDALTNGHATAAAFLRGRRALDKLPDAMGLARLRKILAPAPIPLLRFAAAFLS